MIVNYNSRPYIVLNGVDSRSIKGLLISELAPISKPAIRVQTETIDGRDGDLVTPLGYSSYDKVIKIGLTYEYDVDEVIEFFNGSGKVVFGNEPDKYYVYSIYNQIDFERLIRFKTAEVTFHVQPFKYSDTEGEKSFSFTNNALSREIEIRNNGNYYSRPTLTLTGIGSVDVFINNSKLLTIDFGSSGKTIIIDSQDMNAFNEDRTLLLNRLVSGNYDNIRLKQGKNVLRFNGTINEVIIDKYSRWI